MTMGELINDIVNYEAGSLSVEETLELFSDLIKTGQCWNLQGRYGRTANELINKGLITSNGRINWDNYKVLCEA